MTKLEQFKDKVNIWKFSFEIIWLFWQFQIFGGKKSEWIAFLAKRDGPRPIAKMIFGWEICVFQWFILIIVICSLILAHCGGGASVWHNDLIFLGGWWAGG